jgi:hypothetical protein
MMKKDKSMGYKKGATKKAAMKKGAASKSTGGLTPAQKKLPPALQKAIANRKKSK